MLPLKQQQKAVPVNQMEKQRPKSSLHRTMFQQKKLAEEVANGMDVLNAGFEQIGYKVKEEEIITASAKAAGDKAAA